MDRLIRKFSQWRFCCMMRRTKRLMLRDAALGEIQTHIAKARKAHAPVSHLYALYSERVDQILRGAR